MYDQVVYIIRFSGSLSNITSMFCGPFLKQFAGGLLTVSKLVCVNVHGSLPYCDFCKLCNNITIPIASLALASLVAKGGTG
jgi:hypothetical protein